MAAWWRHGFFETHWFTYDAENRVQVVNGTLANGQIAVTADDGSSDVASYALQYDAAGNAVLRMTVEGVTQTDGSTVDVTKIAQSTYTARGQLETEYAAVEVGDENRGRSTFLIEMMRKTGVGVRFHLK